MYKLLMNKFCFSKGFAPYTFLADENGHNAELSTAKLPLSADSEWDKRAFIEIQASTVS